MHVFYDIFDRHALVNELSERSIRPIDDFVRTQMAPSVALMQEMDMSPFNSFEVGLRP